MKPENFSSDSRAFLSLLAKHQVRYVLIGGLAVIYHGYARLTGDIDFYYDRKSDNVERLWNALREFWDGSVPGVEDSGVLQDPSVVVQFGLPPNRIDLISNLDSVPFDDAWEHRVSESIESPNEIIPVFIIGRADLILSKRDAGRPKDLDDLQQLEG